MKPFKIHCIDPKTKAQVIYDVAGEEVSFLDNRLFVYERDSMHIVTDLDTGTRIAENTHPYDAIVHACERIVNNPETYKMKKQKHIEKYGVLNP